MARMIQARRFHADNEHVITPSALMHVLDASVQAQVRLALPFARSPFPTAHPPVGHARWPRCREHACVCVCVCV